MFEIITLEESNRWDTIVKTFENYDTYYLSGYVKAFKLHGDGEPLLFHYDDQSIRAINVVMKRDIAKAEYFKGKLPEESYYDISTPYGYGGFVIEGQKTEDNLEKLEENYIKLCKKEKIISEFVRFHPVLDNMQDVSSIYDITRLGGTITMKLDSPNQIWDDFEGKNRNVTRKAVREGIEVYWGRSPELFDEFISMYNVTMDKEDAENYYYFEKEFYDSVLTDLRFNSLIFYGKYEGEIIGMSIILFSNNQLHYHLSASKREYMRLAPNNLLLYEAACWGAENGYETFHLGGGLGSKEDGLYRFKRSFNKFSETYFSIGRKIFDQEKYDELVTLRNEKDGLNKKDLFFPLYRA